MPERLATGAYILNSGITKLNPHPEQAAGLHGMAATAYPMVKELEPPQFTRLLAAGEITVGSLLLAPFVRSSVAGAALAGFSGGLVGLYWRTPGMRKPGSIWPSDQGIALAKDSWMFGIGLGLMLSDMTSKRRGRRRGHKRH
jgi:hypothetical protein